MAIVNTNSTVTVIKNWRGITATLPDLLSTRKGIGQFHSLTLLKYSPGNPSPEAEKHRPSGAPVPLPPPGWSDLREAATGWQVNAPAFRFSELSLQCLVAPSG